LLKYADQKNLTNKAKAFKIEIGKFIGKISKHMNIIHSKHIKKYRKVEELKTLILQISHIFDDADISCICWRI